MPWQERSPMELRKQFVTEFRTGLFTMSELCAQYTICRKTGYKWLARADDGGVQALQDQSRQPHGHPATTAPEVVAAILAARRRFPTWSGDTLVRWLARQHPDWAWPQRTTAYEILKRAGAVRTRRRRARSLVRVPAPLHPARAVSVAPALGFRIATLGAVLLMLPVWAVVPFWIFTLTCAVPVWSPIRTRIGTGCHASASSIRCASSAAASASCGVWNATPKASPTI